MVAHIEKVGIWCVGISFSLCAFVSFLVCFLPHVNALAYFFNCMFHPFYYISKRFPIRHNISPTKNFVSAWRAYLNLHYILEVLSNNKKKAFQAFYWTCFKWSVFLVLKFEKCFSSQEIQDLCPPTPHSLNASWSELPSCCNMSTLVQRFCH